MAGSTKAGVITISVRSRNDEFYSDMAKAGDRLEEFAKTGRTAGVEIAKGMAEASSAVVHFIQAAESNSRRLAIAAGADIKQIGAAAENDSKRLASAIAQDIKKLLSSAGADIGALAAFALQHAEALNASGSAAEKTANAYRVLRIALAPTAFTVATVAAGILVEEMVRLTNARGKLIEQQALMASLENRPVGGIEREDIASKLSGSDPNSIQRLRSTLASGIETQSAGTRNGLAALGLSGNEPDLLAKIALALDAIEDPGKRATIAVELFGSQAGEALEQLNPRFAAATEAVDKFGLALDPAARQKIDSFHHDISKIKDAITSLPSVFNNAGEALDTYVERFVAGWWAMEKSTHLAWIRPLITHVGGTISPGSLTPAEITQQPQRTRSGNDPVGSAGQTADALYAATIQEQRIRAEHTIAGLRKQSDEAQARADAASKAIQDDIENRKANAARENEAATGGRPVGIPLPTLSGVQRQLQVQEQQSASARAADLLSRIADIESALKIADSNRAAQAAGGGYEAKRAAEVEPDVQREVKESGANEEETRRRRNAEYDAQHAAESAKSVASTRDEITAQQSLAGAETLGAEAVRQAELAERIRIITRDHDAVSARQLIEVETQLFNARQVTETAREVTSLKTQIADEENLAAAQTLGAEAVRQAELAERIRIITRDHDAVSARQLIEVETQLFNARQVTETAREVTSLKTQIADEENLAAAQTQGAEAVRQAELQNRLNAIARDHDAESARKLTQAEIELYNARRLNSSQEEIASLENEIGAIERVTAAVSAGEAAVHAAELENKIADARRNGNAAAVPDIRAKDEAERELERAKRLQEIIDKTEYLNRLTGAVPLGDEAVQTIEDQHEREQLTRSGNAALVGPTDEQKAAQRRHDAAVQEKAHADATAEAQDAIDEKKPKAEADLKGIQIQAQKLAYERQYGLEVAHSDSDHIANLQKIAAFDAAGRAAKIAGLQKEFEEHDQWDDSTEMKKAADTQDEINRLKAEGANADFKAQTEILNAIQQQNQAVQALSTLAQTLQNWSKIGLGTLENDLANVAVKIPGEISSSITDALFDRRRPGQTRGQAVEDNLAKAGENVGKQLATTLITQAIQKLVAQLIGQSAIAAIQHSVTASNTAALATLTGAVAANTAAQTAAGGASAAGGAAGAAGGVAGGVGSAVGGVASDAATGFTGPLIAAAGGVIGGAISALATYFGDKNLARHIDATTAAVNALRSAGGVTSSTVGPNGQAVASSGTATTPGPSFGGVTGTLSNIPFLSGILGSFGVGGTPVRIVGIDPGVALFGGAISGIAGLLGFATGGRPAPGIPYVVGEKGPELRVDDGPGTILPNGATIPSNISTRASFPEGAARSVFGGANFTSSSRNYATTHSNTFYIDHTGGDPVETARTVAEYLKGTSPQFSPWNS